MVELYFSPSRMAPLSFIGPIKSNVITSFQPLLFPLNCYNSCHNNIPLARIKLPRNNVHVHVHGNSLSPFSYQSLLQKNLYFERQRGTSFNAFDAKNSESEGEEKDNEAQDAVMKLYSAFKNKNTHELSEILADECRRCVCNFLSFFLAFQGKTQVLELFTYLTRKLGNHIEIVVKPTLHDGMNVGVHWKFEWEKIHIPLGKGSSFHISHTYHGRAVIKNIEMFMGPLLLCLEPFRVKMTASLTQLVEKIGSVKVEKRVLCIVIAVLSLAALLVFMKLVRWP